MSVFRRYSQYYDLLYRDKNYVDEANYVHALLKKYGDSVETILELGCGTGVHAEVLASLGYDLHGIDFSEDMLRIATGRKQRLAEDQASRLRFENGDVRDFRSGRKYDSVISLFHVLCYMITDEDLRAAFLTARAHLNPGGIFVFDFWYGPGVMADPPSRREKLMESDTVTIRRFTEPVIFENAHRVDVNFRICVTDKADGTEEELRETHRVRYFYKAEIDSMLSETGFEPVGFHAWMTDQEPSDKNWYACLVAKAK